MSDSKANPNDLFRSQLIIKVVNNDGTEIEESINTLIDECSNLTAEQAAAHHYALKRVYGRILNDISDDDVARFKRAAGA